MSKEDDDSDAQPDSTDAYETDEDANLDDDTKSSDVEEKSKRKKKNTKKKSKKDKATQEGALLEKPIEEGQGLKDDAEKNQQIDQQIEVLEAVEIKPLGIVAPESVVEEQGIVELEVEAHDEAKQASQVLLHQTKIPEIKFFTLEVVERIEVEEKIVVVEAMLNEVNGKTNRIKVTMITTIEVGEEPNLVDVEVEDLYIPKEMDIASQVLLHQTKIPEIKFFTLEVVERIEVEEEIVVVEAMLDEVNGKTNKIKVTMITTIEVGEEPNLMDVEVEDLYIPKEMDIVRDVAFMVTLKENVT
ncbi:hypothetical protein L7F22_028476 [Adiantum nelumboides]|nr:hypothetical protein [Adiantum nelumboides]